ncbi:MAG: ribosome biogenesis GTP-binding protein YihA/YsxC [Campylobacter sp.]|nr:ribosome biogenesis GTP-binding protein YihA/YsxC [Campylobacter sp.]
MSATGIKNSPTHSLSEIAFLGRSNVGKSSLINALVKRKNLAKSSQTPGKTRLINFFEIICKDEDEFSLIFVDLPGFGYAKVSKTMQDEWQKNLDEFLKKRQNIRLFVHLADSRHFDLESDENLNSYINSFIRPDQKLLRVYTKSDKINQSQKAKLLNYDKGAVIVSTLKNSGIDELRQNIITAVFGQ